MDGDLVSGLREINKLFSRLTEIIDPNKVNRIETFDECAQSTMKSLENSIIKPRLKNMIITPTKTDSIEGTEVQNLLSTQVASELKTEKVNAEDLYRKQVIKRGLESESPETKRNLLVDQINDHNELCERSYSSIDGLVQEFKIIERVSKYHAPPRKSKKNFPLYNYMEFGSI